MKDSTPEDNGQTQNERTMRAFAAQFSPPLKVVSTQRLNSIKAHDAWTCSYWSEERGIGVTAVIHGKQLIHAYLEASGESDPDDAATVGKVIAKALGLYQEATSG